MKVSYNWLKEYVDINLPAQELADGLSMAGLVVEGIIETEDDCVFEFERLPNRPDWLNVIGIAREISAVFKVAKIKREIEFEEIEDKAEELIDIEIQDSDLCNRYTARIIEEVTVAQSPAWLTDRLKKSGIRPINNIVDITNYVLLEYGHPLHAFDYEKIVGNKIIVRRANECEVLKTLDNVDRKLTSEMLVIADSEKSIAMAGIMGAGNSEVSDSTVTVLLESAYFNPSSIRASSKKLGLDTEASYRFERGADIDILTTAIDRASELIAELSGGQVLQGIIDVYPNPLEPIQVQVNPAVINSIIGIDISNQDMKEYLEDLDMEVIDNSEEDFIINVPNFRREVIRKEDIAEEIARIYGYENIEATLPVMNMNFFHKNKQEELIKNIKDLLIASGLTEVINYSFISMEEQMEFEQGSIQLKHPLAETQSIMRRSLIPGLLKNLVFNMNNNKHLVDIFEIGKIYSIEENTSKEENILSILMQTDFLELKGVIEDMFLRAGYKDEVEFVPSVENVWCEDGLCCDIIVDGKLIGFTGIFNSQKKIAFGIKDLKTKVVIAEINLEELEEIEKTKSEYTPLAKFPASKRDLALVMDEDVLYQEVVDFILNIQKPFECKVELFDIYRGDQVAEGKKSLAFALTFRAQDRTLTDNEVDEVFTVIINLLEQDKCIFLRTQ